MPSPPGLAHLPPQASEHLLTGPNVAPTFIKGGDLNGFVDEDGPFTASGSFSFRDPNIIDYHVVSATPYDSATVGSLTLDFADATDTVAWHFSVDESVIDHLAKGEVREDFWNVTVTDSHGAKLTELVDIEITGENDAPVVTSDASSFVASLGEGAGITTGNTFQFTDVDTSDTHEVVDISPVGDVLGSVTVENLLSTEDSDLGYVTWQYHISSDDLARLANGEERLEKFLITIDDHNGGSFTQPVEVHIFGTSDDDGGSGGSGGGGETLETVSYLGTNGGVPITGSFVEQPDGMTWIENGVFHFNEVSETSAGATLFDPSRDVTVTMDYASNDLTVGFGSTTLDWTITDVSHSFVPLG